MGIITALCFHYTINIHKIKKASGRKEGKMMLFGKYKAYLHTTLFQENPIRAISRDDNVREI